MKERPVIPPQPPAAPTITARLEAFSASGEPAISVLEVSHVDQKQKLREDVRLGLGDADQPWIPAAWLYDQRGSQLFEEITTLDEYYPTRTEARLLEDLAPWLHDLLGSAQLVELGSGSSTKTEILLTAWGAHREAVQYLPIDINAGMLQTSAQRLNQRFSQLRVAALAGGYDEALEVLPPHDNRLVLFLGGSIGNLVPQAQDRFFRSLGLGLSNGSHLLLGFDRRAHPGKPARVIHEAYNDAKGITACFSMNLLERLNRELAADFDLESWKHVAFYNQESHQVEIYVESQADQTVHVQALEQRYEYQRGQRILTEVSRKFDPDEIAHWCMERGFRCVEQWSDTAGLFNLMLLRREC